jgi:hypothetical protein
MGRCATVTQVALGYLQYLSLVRLRLVRKRRCARTTQKGLEATSPQGAIRFGGQDDVKGT